MKEPKELAVDIDLEGYLEGENDPECTETHFDLDGKEVR